MEIRKSSGALVGISREGLQEGGIWVGRWGGGVDGRLRTFQGGWGGGLSEIGVALLWNCMRVGGN
jgi:hypothetical protein